MPRPNFPNCIMPVEVIRRINEEQEHYDRDPERAEREQRAREEAREEERRQEEEAYRQEIEQAEIDAQLDRMNGQEG
jgi:hypothetical protein